MVNNHNSFIFDFMKQLFFLLVVITGFLFSEVKETLKIKKERSYVKETLELLRSRGIRNEEVVLAQMIKETGMLTSKIYKENKNPFGMKFNSRGFAESKNRGHAKYPSIVAAIDDYAAWQRIRLKAYEAKYGKIETNEQYLHFLDHLVINGSEYRYAEDKQYTTSLREYYIPLILSIR